MNKRYIDFVPSKKTRASVQPSGAVKRTAPVRTRTTTSRVVSGTKQSVVQATSVKRSTEFSLAESVKLGVVEDLNPKFVKTDVPKRPLSEKRQSQTKNELAEAKSKKVGLVRGTKIVRAMKAKAEKTEKKPANEMKATYKTPNSPFINQNKVTKRPLSKNVYQKKIVVPNEEPKGPVTIISKPEKDAHVSLIVTIILTIILGAAAGTVAFLLLPK